MKKFLTVQNGIIVALCIMVGLSWYITSRLHERISLLEFIALDIKNIRQDIDDIKTKQRISGSQSYQGMDLDVMNSRERLDKLEKDISYLDTRVYSIEMKVGY
ncbi:hypothetical protein [Eikenella corrodens]|uniref:DUF2730 family protein n=1 Tax=Eikenella corrodens TaxID=539 RepID=A0A3S9SGG9_EIKCO|nr:hypothetical protein [Eikenella corrodens]AZR58577.1 hypothetical protein ELB75_00060 [Eikenella corrodens]